MERLSPEANLTLNNARWVSCGSHSNFVVSESKKVYSWGFGDSYVLMNTREENLSMPTLVGWSVGKEIEQVHAGSQHVVLFKNPAPFAFEVGSLKRKNIPVAATIKKVKTI